VTGEEEAMGSVTCYELRVTGKEVRSQSAEIREEIVSSEQLGVRSEEEEYRVIPFKGFGPLKG